MAALTRVSLVLAVCFALAPVLISADELTVETFAGNAPGRELRDGPLATAGFYNPGSVAVDGAGNVYVADNTNATIRKITPAGEVTTLAGLSGSIGSTDGTGAAARFNNPTGVAVDGAGNVYVADHDNATIRKITSAGVVTTLAGSAGSTGFADGTGAAARFLDPYGVAVDSAGNVYVADEGADTIRKITPAGVVTTLAGTAGSSGSADGTGAAARFNNPTGVAVDGAGNVYVSDTQNYTIRKITAAGVVTTLAGTAGSAGSANGTGAAARFNFPYGIAVDGAGNAFVAELLNHTIRMVTSAGVVTTLAGTAGSAGSADGTGAAARFNQPNDVAVDSGGNVYVADRINDMIRVITSGGVVTTLSGTVPSTSGSADGTGAAARFNNPRGVAVDGAGNVYVADYDNSTIRKITPAGVVTTLAGTAGYLGVADGTGAAARFYNPIGVAVDSAGNVYVADGAHTIRKITPAGVVTTLAGSPASSGSTDGTGAAARFNNPAGVAVDGAGNVYVSDTLNYTIRKITPAGVVTTLAGTAGSAGSTDGTGAAARFNQPMGLAVDSVGNVYVADRTSHTIRMITSGGVVTTLAGTAYSGGSTDGTGAAARFDRPRDVAVDSAGNVYVADADNHTIRLVTSAGVVTTMAGTAGSSGSADGVGAAARFSEPTGVAVDSAGNVYVGDTLNNTIRKCTPALLDAAGIDQTVGLPGQLRQLQATHGTATSWRWEWTRHPGGSAAVLSSTTERNPTFTPDISDIYSWRLYASGPGGLRISDVTLTVNAGTPILTMQTSLPYATASGAVVIDASATVQDADSADFDTGNLTILNTGFYEDTLSIQTAGTIRLNGTDVEHDASSAFSGSEVVIGTLSSDGQVGADLVIAFNASCTPAIAQELLQHVTFENVSPFPDTTPRTVRVSVTDDDGLTSAPAYVLLFPPASSTGGGSDDNGGCSTGTSSTSLWLLLALIALPVIIRQRKSKRAA